MKFFKNLKKFAETIFLSRYIEYKICANKFNLVM